MRKFSATLILLLTLVIGGYSQNTLLWRVEKQGVQSSYLFGTFHIFPKEKFEISEKVKKAFDECEQLVMELAMEPGFEMKMMQLASMPDDKTLEDFLDQSELEKLDSALATIGMPRMIFNTWRPFFVTSIFYQSYLPGGIASFEFSLLEMANNSEMAVKGLETIERQIEIFDKIPYEDQADDLMEMIMDFDKNKALFDQMVGVYLDEDIEGMVSMAKRELNNENEIEFLLNERNKEWIPKMEELMKDNQIFFAVGAGHLGGKKGVIQGLKNRGFILTPIM